MSETPPWLGEPVGPRPHPRQWLCDLATKLGAPTAWVEGRLVPALEEIGRTVVATDDLLNAVARAEARGTYPAAMHELRALTQQGSR